MMLGLKGLPCVSNACAVVRGHCNHSAIFKWFLIKRQAWIPRLLLLTRLSRIRRLLHPRARLRRLRPPRLPHPRLPRTSSH